MITLFDEGGETADRSQSRQPVRKASTSNRGLSTSTRRRRRSCWHRSAMPAHRRSPATARRLPARSATPRLTKQCRVSGAAYLPKKRRSWMGQRCIGFDICLKHARPRGRRVTKRLARAAWPGRSADGSALQPHADSASGEGVGADSSKHRRPRKVRNISLRQCA